MIIAFYPGAGGNRYLKRISGEDWTATGISYDNQVLDQLYSHRYLLEEQLPAAKTKYVLTHCMNSKKIQQMFPNKLIVFINSNLQQSLKREWILAGHARFACNKIKSNISRVDHYNAIKDPSWPEIDSDEQLKTLPESISKEVNCDYNKVIDISTSDTPEVLLALTQKYIDEINSAYEIIKWHKDYYQKFPVDFSAAEKIINVDLLQDDFSLLMNQELALYHSQVFDQVWKKIDEQ